METEAMNEMTSPGAGDEPKRKRGRPPKLTPETEAKILSAIRCGASKKTACAAAGIAESTLGSWVRAAKEPGAPREYRELTRKLERARQEGIVARLAIVQKAAQTDWRAATWLLERDCPDEYSLKYRLEHSVKPMTLVDALSAVRRQRDAEELGPPGAEPRDEG